MKSNCSKFLKERLVSSLIWGIVYFGNLGAKAINRLLLREDFYCKNLTLVSSNSENASRKLQQIITKGLTNSKSELSSLLWCEFLIYLQINWAIYNHNLRIKSNRFRPFGLFRKNTHSSIGEERLTRDEL